MRLTRIKLESWRNFLSVDVPLQRRAFLVGPNASGKSNFLDALRFLRDIADPKGGFQTAVALRGGVSQLRSLHARRKPNVSVEVSLDLNGAGEEWIYRLEFSQDNQRTPKVSREVVRLGNKTIIERRDAEDRDDTSRLTQTYLQQVNVKKTFRMVADAFAQSGIGTSCRNWFASLTDPWAESCEHYGGDFLEQLARTNRRTFHRDSVALPRHSRLPSRN